MTKAQVSLAYLTILVVGASFAWNSWIGKHILQPVLKPFIWAGRKFAKFLWQATKEIGVWLGYEGKRLLVFLTAIAILIACEFMFGSWVTMRVGIMFFILALTTRKRRMARNSRYMRELNKGIGEVKTEIKKLHGEVPTVQEAKGAYTSWKSDRSRTATGIDPNTGTVATEAMADPDYFNKHRSRAESFREHLRKQRGKEQP